MTTTDLTENIEIPQSRASARYVRMSASKARRVVDLVRGAGVQDALAILKFAPQAASVPVRKLVESARANAEHNYGLDRDALTVAAIWVDEGPTLRRFRPRAQGRAGQIRHRSCHITVVLEPAAEESGRTSEQNRRSR